MKRVKRIIALILSVAMMLSVNLTSDIAATQVKADTTFAITAPANGSLVAAGYIDIKWTAPTDKPVNSYTVYINGSKITTTTALQYEYYTTKVNYHTAWIEANYADGTKTTTTNVRFGVSKKGICVDRNMGRGLDPADIKATWYYNWGMQSFKEMNFSNKKFNNTEFVPMVWKETNANNFKNKVNSLKDQGYKYVLTFNEPDLKGQCDMPLNDVYNTWQGIDDVTGIKVSSPVAAIFEARPKPGKPAPQGWLKRFIDKIDVNNDHDVDFISIHCYPDNFQGAAMAKWFASDVVDYAWERYHKPIWITEISTQGEYINKAGTKSCIEALLPLLDEREYVERYSWFSWDSLETGLFLHSTGRLSEPGMSYAKLGNPTTDLKTGNYVNKNGQSVIQVEKPTTKPVVVKKPARVKIKSARNIKGRKIKISIKKIKKAAGYQIRYSDSRKFDGYWTKSTKKTTYTLKRLDKKTRYYIKVRAYVKNGKRKLYGAWSKPKRIKVKK